MNMQNNTTLPELGNSAAIQQAVEDVRQYLSTGNHPWPPVEENNAFRSMTPKEVYQFCHHEYRYEVRNG